MIKSSFFVVYTFSIIDEGKMDDKILLIAMNLITLIPYDSSDTVFEIDISSM